MSVTFAIMFLCWEMPVQLFWFPILFPLLLHLVPSLTCAKYKDFPNNRRSLFGVGLGWDVPFMRAMTYQVTGLSKLKSSMDFSNRGHYFLAGIPWSSSFCRRCLSLSSSSISTESRGTVILQLLFLKLPYTYTIFLFALYTPWNSHCPRAVTTWL